MLLRLHTLLLSSTAESSFNCPKAISIPAARLAALIQRVAFRARETSSSGADEFPVLTSTLKKKNLLSFEVEEPMSDIAPYAGAYSRLVYRRSYCRAKADTKYFACEDSCRPDYEKFYAKIAALFRDPRRMGRTCVWIGCSVVSSQQR
ncbi:uncharacterized protein EDB91DRAFT_616057 [Suillus paluster]|uniref:uncharacterized protein n=1 Tax=Suillus paluster TaxID=48578 RepID=UPI001B883429|nr:uncharacterized protein EDB91DRAFT_616057 [Suillus paluster]KAG1751622.1 hypothetical protein EDB91DRAFT_616057 [Suillus paluster]